MKTNKFNTTESDRGAGGVTVEAIGILNTLSVEPGRVLNRDLVQMIPDKKNSDSVVFMVESVEVYGDNGAKQASIRRLIFKPDTKKISLKYLKKFRTMLDDLIKFNIKSWNTAIRVTRVEDSAIYCEFLEKKFVLETINKKLQQIFNGK